MDKRGIKDILEDNRYSLKHIQKALIDREIPGNWMSTQNVYNLINGNTIPRDGYVYIFLSDFLNTDIRKVLCRYSKKQTSYAGMDSDIF